MADTDATPTFLVVFAGPNGSGKSTLTDQVRKEGRVPFPDDAHYINPDEIQKSLHGSDPKALARLASIEADKRRYQFLERGESFAFETVLPHPSKLGVMLEAKQRDYAVALFFVATESPALNAERVAQRVLEGGHDVPRDKIPERYERAMRLLPRATEIADLSSIFDNTSRELPLRESVRILDGQVMQLAAVANWTQRALLDPREERQNDQAHLSAKAAELGLTLSRADELGGAYAGRIAHVTSQFVLQTTPDSRAILHDRAVLEIGSARSYSVGDRVDIAYSAGVARATNIDRAVSHAPAAPSKGKGPER